MGCRAAVKTDSASRAAFKRRLNPNNPHSQWLSFRWGLRQGLRLVGLLVMLGGCAGGLAMTSRGQPARPENRFPIRALQGQETTWQGPELALHYTAEHQTGNLVINGQVERRGPILKYPNVKDAVVYLHFLDAAGIILDTKLLWSSLGFNSEKFVRWTFARAWPVPPGAEAIGFSYRGSFSDSGSDYGSDAWEVWQRP